jgi:hypothetical protein
MKSLLSALFLPLLAASAAPALAASPELPPLSQVGEPEVAFDEGRYQLGYEIYLAKGNLAAAYRVADRAVREQPQSVLWRKNLAQVALWLGRSDVALQNWLQIARQTNSAEAWEQVGKLGPALADDEAVLLWQRREVELHPADRKRLNDLLAAYEHVGRPEEGLAFLARLRRTHNDRELYEAEALLAERTGHDELALADLKWLNTHYGPDEGWLLRAAALKYQRGDLQGANQELATAESRMPDTAVAYWRTHGELALLLGDNKTALNGYGHVYASGKYSEGDLLNYAALMQAKDPVSAAKLQALVFTRFGRVDAASSALYLWTRENRLKEADSFLASLTPEQLALLENDAAFLEFRGRLREAEGRWHEALADYAAGLRLAPNRASLQQAWLSQLIEHGRPEALRRVLIEHASAAQASSTLQSLWAAGWSRLDEPLRALPYLKARHESAPGNALNALAYADALSRAGLTDAARRLENTVWQGRSEALAGLPAEQKTALQQALLNVELARIPVESQRRYLRALVQQSRDAQGRVSPWVRDLVLGTAWASDAVDSLPLDVTARLPATPDTPLPVWSPLLMALADHDKPALQELIATRLDELPIYDRVEAAERLDRFDLAASLAFESAEIRQDDDEMHRRLQERAWNDASRVDLSFQHDKQGSLTRTPLALAWKGHLDGNDALGLRIETAGLDSDPAVLRLPVDLQQRYEFSFSRKGENFAEEIALTAFDSLDSVVGLRGKANANLPAGVSAEARAGWHQLATSTSGLTVGGQRDFVGGGLAWAITGRDIVALDLEYSRLAAQGGGDLGSTLVSGLTYSHRLFSGERDWVVKTGVSTTSSSSEAVLPDALKSLLPPGVQAGPEYFVPGAFTQFSLALAFGENAEQSYQRGWRSFWEIGLTQDAETGIGYDYRLGILGRVLGRDRLRLYVDGADGAQGNGEKTQTFNVDYRLWY